MTGQQTLILLARLTGYQLPTWKRLIRDLRESGLDVWPTSGKGGGRSARHVQLRHLAALLLAIGEGGVIGAATVAAEIGSYKGSFDGASSFTDHHPAIRDALPGLQERLCRVDVFSALAVLIDWLTLDDTKAALVEATDFAIEAELRFRLDVGYAFGFVCWTGKPFHDSYTGEQVVARYYKPESMADLAHIAQAMPAVIERTCTFNFEFLKALALCWQDTKSAQGNASDPSTGSSSLSDVDGPEVEAPAPGSAGTSDADQFGSDKHPTTYPTAFETRGDGMSSGAIKARPEGSSLGSNPRRSQSHERDPRERACA